MKRLDQVITEQFGSRTKAQDAIKAKRVQVNGKVITKPGFKVEDTDTIHIEAIENEFVSRAGNKLQAAFDRFDIDVQDQVALDVGASTGGFTEVCLNHGAKKVYALDVGHLQLAKSLAEDSRVIKMEGFNAKDIQADTFADPIDFICMDVSFISCRKVLEILFEKVNFQHMAVLIKPQFECGPHYLNKHGVLTNEKIAQQIVIDTERFCMRKFRNVKTIKSPIKGRNGNQEYICYASIVR